MAGMMQHEGWSISSFEMVSRGRFDWARTTNPFELAVILRDDSRFVELEPGLFSLATAVRPAAVPLSQSLKS